MRMEQTNNIGFGILCFGDKKYYDGTVYKLNRLLNLGYKCYVLTDNPEFFYSRYTPLLLTIIEYKREYKSYHDKILIVKEILLNHDVAIILDADTNYNFDFTPLKNLKNYNFKDGISYIENLSNHRINKSSIKEMDLMLKNDWKMYFAYVNSKIGDFTEKETIWEHFLVFKKQDYSKFFKLYEKLQLIKEYCDVLENKDIIGAGEGITLIVCSMETGVPLQKDLDLYNKVKDLLIYE